MRYEIKFRVRAKFAKSYQQGSHRFSRLDKVADFVERMRNKPATRCITAPIKNSGVVVNI